MTAQGSPAAGTPEWQAARLAGSLLKQDAARQALRRLEPPPEAEPYDPSAGERRRWALQEASLAQPAERMGPDRPGEGLLLPSGHLVLVRRKGGAIQSMAAGVVRQVTIGPQEWDEFDRAWCALRRRRENELLAAHYGKAVCLAGGLFTEAEARELPDGPPRGPGGAPYRVERSVA